MSNESEKSLREFEGLARLNPEAFEAECRRVAEMARRYGWIRPVQAKKNARDSLESRARSAAKPV